MYEHTTRKCMNEQAVHILILIIQQMNKKTDIKVTHNQTLYV